MKLPRALATLTLLLVLAGCAPQLEEANQDQAPTISPSTESSIEPSIQPEPQESQSASSPSPCNSEVLTGIQESISSQTQAFALEDFELAYSFASPNFRQNVNLQSFVAVISSSYGPLLSSSELQFSECLNNEQETIGVIDVRFVEGDAELYGLRYLMVATDEGWRVEGASNLQLVASGS
jgi:hypothetical protein